MNTRSREIVLIGVALLVILGAGYGLGNLLSRDRTVAPPPSVSLNNLEAETLSALREALALTSEQELAIEADLSETTAEILQIREQALFEYHQKILALHDKLAPRLDPDQQEILRDNREKLEETIERRFPDLLGRTSAEQRVSPAPQHQTP